MQYKLIVKNGSNEQETIYSGKLQLMNKINEYMNSKVYEVLNINQEVTDEFQMEKWVMEVKDVPAPPPNKINDYYLLRLKGTSFYLVSCELASQSFLNVRLNSDPTKATKYTNDYLENSQAFISGNFDKVNVEEIMND